MTANHFRVGFLEALKAIERRPGLNSHRDSLTFREPPVSLLRHNAIALSASCILLAESLGTPKTLNRLSVPLKAVSQSWARVKPAVCIIWADFQDAIVPIEKQHHDYGLRTSAAAAISPARSRVSRLVF